MARLVKPARRSAAFAPGAEEGDQYLARVAKYVPGEVVAVYVSLLGLVPLANGTVMQNVLYVVVFLACLAATPLYLNATAEPGQARLTHLIVSTFAFVVWAYSLGGVFKAYGIHQPAVGGIVLVLFTLFAGLLTPAARAPQPARAGHVK